MKRTLFTIFVLVFSSLIFAGDLNQDILENRTGYIVIETSPKSVVQVEQLEHEFWFGGAICNQAFDGRLDSVNTEIYKQKFLENFNSAVTENALKWWEMEPQKGIVNFGTVDNILTWTDANDLPLRGHNIYWGVPYFVQQWLKELDDKALYQQVFDRAQTISTRYKGRFTEYDFNNEMIHGNYYEERFGKDITPKMTEWIKANDPDAVLYLNDYDILTANKVREFCDHVKELQSQGALIDGIGVQGHLHGESFNPDSLKFALDMLAQFDLPVRVTEFNMPGQRSKFYEDKELVLSEKEEQQKAQNLVDYYRICFAHPVVEGILMWGFWEGVNWIPVSSLYKKDWTPTPALKAYQNLIFDEWWTKFSGKADKNGLCTVRAFYGKHKVSANGKEMIVDLNKCCGAVHVKID